ncbi:metallophosphoesterase [Longispora albida]|uniref:metallophosphoesterase n=1 Tax=Longispora albida TaxID=203523 RepID=UPI000374F666|nr:metallophosphoesterase [Longispora albida]
MLIFAHISDTHLDGGERAAARTRAVTGYLAHLAAPIDAVLVTGDIADHGLAEEYKEAREALELPYPVMILPGNHDNREEFQNWFGPVNVVREVDGARFLLCDSTIPGRDDGYLPDETLAWIDAELAASDAPSFVCFHHPPVMLHNTLVDSLRQTGEERLSAVLAKHAHLTAVLCGHAHTAAVSTFAGKPMLVGGGVVSTLLLPWETGEHITLDDPPVIAFHVLDDANRLTTHYRIVR